MTDGIEETGEIEPWRAELLAHVKAVHDWVDAHVQIIEAADRVTLREFSWEREDARSVHFVLGIEGQGDHRCYFGGGDDGDVRFTLPQFHSPLGAPASYPAVELSEAVDLAVRTGLRSLMPRLKPCGTDPVTGEQVTFASSLRTRLGVPLETVRGPILREGLAVTVEVATLAVIATWGQP